MATLGSVVVEMSASTAKFESDLGRAAAMAERQMLKIDSMVSMATSGIKGLAVALTAGFSVDKITGKIQAAIDQAAELQQLAERTGAAAGALSGLASVAKLSGTDVDSLATGLQKLSKSTVERICGG